MPTSPLLKRFGMDARSLQDRRAFIGLGDKEAKVLLALKDWIRTAAPAIAMEFYDHQFSFGPTLKFFEGVARRKRIRLEVLRQTLESAQAQYLVDIFDGADSLWGEQYFEKRLKVGMIHDQLNLPLKWYLGSYIKFQEAVRAHLLDHFEMSEHFLEAESAIHKVFNYDMQAVADAFTMSNLESMGMAVEGVEVIPGRDVTEYLGDLKEDMKVLVEQADAIARDDLKAKVLEKQIDGCLGTSFHTMVVHLKENISQLEAMAIGDLHVHQEFGDGTMGECMKVVHQTLLKLVDASENIMQGTREGDYSRRFPDRQFLGHYRSLCSGINELLDLSFGMLSFNSQVLSGSSEGLRGMSQTLLSDADEISHASQDSADVVKDLNLQVQTVNTGMEQMSEAVREISSNAADVSHRADDAAEKAHAAGETVARLQESSERIGDVIKSVRNIAQQTNLLALNATIEAARAGEAGKGFAVVAGEVKELSKETRDATQDITNMVSRIQKDTSMAVEAISQIAELNAHLKDISGSIASAVEEQSIVTRETTNSLGDIAQRNRSMVAKMESIVEAVGKTKSSCEKLDSMALFQSRTASELEAVVGKGDGDFIKWSDEYSVSVPSIDEQHKVLFRLVNQLFSGVKAMDQEVIHEVLDELVNYTVNHFKFEEQIFSKIHYSHEADHKDHHKALVTQVGSFVKEFKSGQGMVDFRLLNFLRSWLKGHILIEDMKYKDEMIRAGIR